jgi:alpha-mannosidase
VTTDEACPNFEDMILNIMKGHQFLKREFGVTSRIGWNVDSFGHSAANAALYHDFGFEALFFSRMDDRLRAQLIKKGEMNFLWEPFSKHFGEEK